MEKERPRNGYYWTEREMMLRRDARLFQQKHNALTFAPLPGLLAAPAGWLVVIPTFLIAALAQRVINAQPRDTGDREFTVPAQIQRLGIILTALVSLGTLQVWGLFACWLWWLFLNAALRFSRQPSEQNAKRAAARAPADLRIRE